MAPAADKLQSGSKNLSRFGKSSLLNNHAGRKPAYLTKKARSGDRTREKFAEAYFILQRLQTARS